jgi:DHA2 family multidrug resistance protein
VNYGNPAAMSWLDSVGANYSTFGLDGSTVALQKLSQIISQQAWLLSFMDVFSILTVVFGSLICFVFLIAKPARQGGGGGGH